MAALGEFGAWLVVEVAGPFGSASLAGKLLADLGCTVARVVTPDADEPDASPSERGLRELVDRGKQSVDLDWTERSSDVLDTMLRAAEILVVDRPGLLRLQALMGRDFRGRYPRLTVLACTPFGLAGPMAEWTGGEEIVQAAAGIMSITGHPGSGPTRVAGIPLTYAAAMYAVTSAVGDVLRKRTGEGASLLDVSVYDAAIAFQSASFPAYFLSGRAPSGIGNRHSMSVPWNSFRCRDGWVIVCAGNQPNWVRLCEMIGRPDFLADPRLATQEGRIGRVDEIEAAISAWMAPRSVAQVEALLAQNTIAGGSILPLPDVLRHPQFRERELASGDGARRAAGAVFHVDRAPLPVSEGCWRRGTGARAVLVDRCHAGEAQYAQWLASGVVIEPREAAHA